MSNLLYDLVRVRIDDLLREAADRQRSESREQLRGGKSACRWRRLTRRLRSLVVGGGLVAVPSAPARSSSVCCDRTTREAAR